MPIGPLVLEADQRQTAAENALNVVLQEQLRRERRFLGSYIPSSTASSLRSTPVGVGAEVTRGAGMVGIGAPRFGTPMSLTRDDEDVAESYSHLSTRPGTASSNLHGAHGEHSASLSCPLCEQLQRDKMLVAPRHDAATSILRDETQDEAGYRKGSLSQTVRFCTRMVHQSGVAHVPVDASELLLKLEAIETTLRTSRVQAEQHGASGLLAAAEDPPPPPEQAGLSLSSRLRDSPLRPTTRSTGTNTPTESGDEQVASVLKRRVNTTHRLLLASRDDSGKIAPSFSAAESSGESSALIGPRSTFAQPHAVAAIPLPSTLQAADWHVASGSQSENGVHIQSWTAPHSSQQRKDNHDSDARRQLSDQYTRWADWLHERAEGTYQLKMTLFHGAVMGSMMARSVAQRADHLTSPQRQQAPDEKDLSAIEGSPIGAADSILVATPSMVARGAGFYNSPDQLPSSTTDRFVFSAKCRILLDSEEDLRTTLEIEELHRRQELGNMLRINFRRAQAAQSLREGLALLLRQHAEGRGQIESEQERLRRLVQNALLNGMLAIEHRRRQESMFSQMQHLLQAEGLTRIDLVADESRIRGVLLAVRNDIAALVHAECESRELLMLDQSRRRRDCWDRHFEVVSRLRRAEDSAREERLRLEAEQERVRQEQERLEGLRLEEEVRQDRERRRRELEAHYEKTREELCRAERENAAAREQWLAQRHAALTALAMSEARARADVSTSQASARRELYASFNRGVTEVLKWEEAREAADAQLVLEESRRELLLRAAAARSMLRASAAAPAPVPNRSDPVVPIEAPPPAPTGLGLAEAPPRSQQVERRDAPVQTADERKRRKKRGHRPHEPPQGHGTQAVAPPPAPPSPPPPPPASSQQVVQPADATAREMSTLQRENEELRLLLIQRQEERASLLRNLREATRVVPTTSPEIIQRQSTSPEQPSLSPPREPQPLHHQQVQPISIPTASRVARDPARPMEVSLLPEPHPFHPRPMPKKPRRNILLQPPWNGSVSETRGHPRHAIPVPHGSHGSYTQRLSRQRSPGGTPHRYEVPTTSFLEQASLKYQVEYITDHWTQHGHEQHRHMCHDRYCEHLGLH